MNPNIQTLAKTAVSLMVSALLAACAVGPNYSKPKDELAPFHNNPMTEAQRRESQEAPQARRGTSGKEGQASLDQWWTGFDDVMLTEVVQRALSQNLDLAASIARVQQARAAAAGAGAALLPSADFHAGSGKTCG